MALSHGLGTGHHSTLELLPSVNFSTLKGVTETGEAPKMLDP
jgi:hypothetical protein